MTVFVYHDPGTKSWEEAPDPSIEEDTHAVVRVDTTTLCGTDPHMLKGDPRGDRGANSRPPGGRHGRAGHRRGYLALARRLSARVVPLGVRPVPFLSLGPLRAVHRGRSRPLGSPPATPGLATSSRPTPSISRRRTPVLWTWVLIRWEFRQPRGSAQSRRPDRRAYGRGPTA
jgi:hypothetical protein